MANHKRKEYLKKSLRRSQQLISLEKQTKKIDEISKYATRRVNINIKSLFGHSDHEPNYLKMSNAFHAQGLSRQINDPVCGSRNSIID